MNATFRGFAAGFLCDEPSERPKAHDMLNDDFSALRLMDVVDDNVMEEEEGKKDHEEMG
jgi:hypothetical protein